MKESSSLHNFIFPSDKEIYEWVAKEPLWVVSTFTNDVKVGTSLEDWEVITLGDNKLVCSMYPIIMQVEETNKGIINSLEK